jgi:hypothetical protein
MKTLTLDIASAVQTTGAASLHPSRCILHEQEFFKIVNTNQLAPSSSQGNIHVTIILQETWSGATPYKRHYDNISLAPASVTHQQ